MAAYQHMLFGLHKGEIVAEVQVPKEHIHLLDLPAEPLRSLPVSVEIAKQILIFVGRKAPETDEWYVECQQLYRR